MCEPEYSLNLLHRKHPFYLFFLKAYSIAFFSFCHLTLPASCQSLLLQGTNQRQIASWIVMLYPRAKVPQFGSIEQAQLWVRTIDVFYAINNKVVIIPDTDSWLLIKLRFWLCLLSRHAQPYSASCRRFWRMLRFPSLELSCTAVPSTSIA